MVRGAHEGPAVITTAIDGVDLTLETAPTLFSPRAVDKGTLAMLGQVEFAPGAKVLDLGCGYGVVGILAAKLGARVWMLDKDPIAVGAARRNAARNDVELAIIESDGFRDFGESGFDLILCNPPYQADFAVPKHFIEKGFNRLVVGGRMLMVTKRELWYRNKLAAIFGGVTVRPIDGYVVFQAVKKSETYANRREPKARSSPGNSVVKKAVLRDDH